MNLPEMMKKGELLVRDGKLREAEEQFLLVLQHDHENKEAYNNLGFIAFSQMNIEKAVTLFTKAIDVDPLYLDAILNLCDVLRSTNSFAEALAIIEEALERDPENTELTKMREDIRSAVAAKTNIEDKEIVDDVHDRAIPPDPESPRPARTDRHEGDPAVDASSRDLSMALCCLAACDTFVDDWLAALGPGITTRKIASSNSRDFSEDTIGNADIVWLEWGNDLAAWFTHEGAPLLSGKRVICRIHSYEALDGLADRIDFRCIDDLIFVARHIRDIFLARKPEVAGQVKRIHIVPNGIDIGKFSLPERSDGFNIACIGSLNHKKDPMVMLHAFRRIHAWDSRYRLFIAGGLQEPRYHWAIPNFLKHNGLEDAVRLEGHVSDIAAWLEDKHYIICSSLMEGHPVGLMEAMARGCGPLIFNFPGAEAMYPRAFLWNNDDELIERLKAPYAPAAYRRFVAENFSLGMQVDRFRRILLQSEAVVANGFHYRPVPVEPPSASSGTPVSAGELTPWQEACKSYADYEWSFPPAAFARDPAVRATILLAEAKKQIAQRKIKLARTTMERVVRMTGYGHLEGIQSLCAILAEEDDFPALKALWKRSAVAFLLRGNLDSFLHCLYLSNYAEIIYGKRQSYRHSQIDEDINAFMELAARTHPLREWIATETASRTPRPREDKIRVGYLVEGLSAVQAPVAFITGLADYYDPTRFELFYYSRLPLTGGAAEKERYGETATRLRQKGCVVKTPAHDLSPTDAVSFLVTQIVQDRIDMLLYQTAYWVPVYNFISCLRPAPFQAYFTCQQVEHLHNMDLSFTLRSMLLEENCPAETTLFHSNRDHGCGTHARGDFGIPAEAVVLTTAGTDSKYADEFIEEMEALLLRHPNAWYIPLGLQSNERFREDVRPRVLQVGFRNDVMSFFRMADLYVDTWPMGGGSSVLEAIRVGLPMAAFRIPYGTFYNVERYILSGLYAACEDLVLLAGDIDGWHRLMDRLISDSAWRESMRDATVTAGAGLGCEQSITSFYRRLEEAFRGTFDPLTPSSAVIKNANPTP